VKPGTSLQHLRHLMTGRRSSGRPRLPVLLTLAFLMVTQVIALSHLTGHTAQGDNAHCAICVSASHAGNAVPASANLADIQNLAARPAVPVVTGQSYRSPPVVYRSRAPPAFA
jgi:hypothetical protein